MNGHEPIRVLAVIPGTGDGQSFIFARRQVRQLRARGAEVTTFFLAVRTDPIQLVREARRFRRLVRLLRPGVVHAHYGTVTALFAVMLSPCPVVVTFRGSDLNGSSEVSWLRRFVSRVMSQFAGAFASRVICVSEELKSQLWFRKRHAEVIPTGVDLEEFKAVGRDEARAKLGWALGDRVVLFNDGAAHSLNKRFDLIETAMRRVVSELRTARLIVMKGDVDFTEVPLYMSAADALVLASDHEGSPNVIKEALACNLPVCSVDVGDVRRMGESVERFVLVSRTPPSIANGLLGLLRSPGRSNGRQFSERFSAEKTTDRVLEVLNLAAGS